MRFISEDALVSYTIISYVNTIVVMSMTGIVQGSQPLTSYYFGKGEPKKYRKLLKYGILSAAVFSVVVTAGCYAGASGIVGIFLDGENPALSVYSIKVFRIFILSFLLAGYNVVIGGYFASIEKAGFATFISLTRSLIALGGCMMLLIAVLGGEGIWWSPLMAEAVCLVFSLLMLKRSFAKQRKN